MGLSRSNTLIVVSIIMPFLAIVAVFLRFWSRRAKRLQLALDDYLIIPALLLTIGLGVNNIVGATVGRIGKHEVLKPDGFPVGDNHLKVYGQVLFALQIMHTCAMPIIKASVLVFYTRLFVSRGFHIAVYVIGGYVTLWFISVLFATIFQCSAISDNWGTTESQFAGCLPTIIYMYQTAAITNVISDLAILTVPWPIVWKLQMPKMHKIAVSAIFLTGTLVVIAGIGRTVAYFKVIYTTSTDFSYNDYSLVAWTVVEPSLGVISACLPTMRPLFSGLSPESVINTVRSKFSLRSLTRTRGSRETASNKQDLGSERSLNTNDFHKIPDDSVIENKISGHEMGRMGHGGADKTGITVQTGFVQWDNERGEV